MESSRHEQQEPTASVCCIIRSTNLENSRYRLSPTLIPFIFSKQFANKSQDLALGKLVLSCTGRSILDSRPICYLLLSLRDFLQSFRRNGLAGMLLGSSCWSSPGRLIISDFFLRAGNLRDGCRVNDTGMILLLILGGVRYGWCVPRLCLL